MQFGTDPALEVVATGANIFLTRSAVQKARTSASLIAVSLR